MKSSSDSKQDYPKILYPKSDSVKVTKEKAPTSEIVQALGRGEAVRVIEKSGSRYRVKLPKGKTGWVSKHRFSEQKPSEKPQDLSDLAKLKEKERPTVIESRTPGSIRG